MLIDSNIFVDLLKGKTIAKKFLQKENNLSTSIIVLMEIIAGFSSKKQIEEFQELINNLNIHIYQINEIISVTAYHLFASNYHRCHVGVADAFIAATAVCNHEKLATLNIKHFKILPEIEVIKPY